MKALQHIILWIAVDIPILNMNDRSFLDTKTIRGKVEIAQYNSYPSTELLHRKLNDAYSIYIQLRAMVTYFLGAGCGACLRSHP